MKQYTIEEAVNLINVKFSVTPEQAIKFHKLYNETHLLGTSLITPSRYNDEKFLYINDECKLEKGIFIDTFNRATEEEIELIESPIFKNQQDVFSYLSIEGNKIIFTGCNVEGIVGFREGVLWDFIDNARVDYLIKDYNMWIPYIEPVKPLWYETNPDRFVMCKVWDETKGVCEFTYTPVKWDIESTVFIDLAGLLWDCAEPVVLDELTQYIL